MAPIRMIDCVHRAKAFHKELSEFFSNQSDKALRPDVKEFLKYLSWHEAFIERCLDDYERGATRDLLDAWFKIAPDFNQFLHPTESMFRPDMTTGEVVDLALRLDDCMVRMCEQLLRNAGSSALQDVLNDLVNLERREEMKVLFTANP